MSGPTRRTLGELALLGTSLLAFVVYARRGQWAHTTAFLRALLE